MTANVSAMGILRYLYDSDVHSIHELMEPTKVAVEGPWLFSVIPMSDLLLEIKVEGTFSSASMYGFDDTGSTKVYWATTKTNNERMRPFPLSGIPMCQYRKCVFVEVFDKGDDVHVTAKFATLDEQSKKCLGEFKEGDHGVKLWHTSGAMYQVHNVRDGMNYTLNALMPVSKPKLVSIKFMTEKFKKVAKSLKKKLSVQCLSVPSVKIDS